MAALPVTRSPGPGPSGGPMVSAVIIFCNEIEFLAEAVDSVYAQTMTDWELLLVDDGSTDGSSQLAAQLAAERPGQVRHLHHPDGRTRGMSASRNLGVRAATGRYIAYLDGDDRWLPEKLERQLALLGEHPEAGIVYGPLRRWYSWTGRPAERERDDLYGIHGDGYTLQPGSLFEPPELVALLVRHKDLVPSGAMFERALFLDVGGAEDEFTDNYEDAVVFVKMGLRAAAYCGDDSWYLYRQYPRPEDRRRRAAGRPDADRLRGDEARLRFLDWVDGYLAAEGVASPLLRAAIRDARRQILNPGRHRLHRSLRRGSRLARRLVTGAGGASRAP